MTKPLVTNAGNKSQVSFAERKLSTIGENQKRDMQMILKLPEGRRFLWLLLGECRIYRTSFDHSGSVTAFNEGKRSVGLAILDRITDADPSAYIQMQNENKGEL